MTPEDENDDWIDVYEQEIGNVVANVLSRPRRSLSERNAQRDSMPHDEHEESQEERPRGRLAPSRMMDIRIGDEVIGSVDPSTLTWGAALDLEEMVKTADFVQWLVTYAGADKDQVIAAMRPIPLWDVDAIRNDVTEAIRRATQVPKVKRSR